MEFHRGGAGTTPVIWWRSIQSIQPLAYRAGCALGSCPAAGCVEAAGAGGRCRWAPRPAEPPSAACAAGGAAGPGCRSCWVEGVPAGKGASGSELGCVLTAVRSHAGPQGSAGCRAGLGLRLPSQLKLEVTGQRGHSKTVFDHAQVKGGRCNLGATACPSRRRMVRPGRFTKNTRTAQQTLLLCTPQSASPPHHNISHKPAATAAPVCPGRRALLPVCTLACAATARAHNRPNPSALTPSWLQA